jgi:uncharacterized protein with ParB-like and HNH nuclease domain
MSKKFEPDYLTMNDLFKRENIYCIPINQRKYSWKKDQYEEYWNDIVSTISCLDKRHYLGVITLVKKMKIGIVPDEYEVIDGQQRLITTFIFIAAIRDIYVTIKDIEGANDIHNTYLRFKTARNRYERVKSSKVDEFTLNSLINISPEMISEITLGENDFRSADIDPSEFINSNVVNAYKFFCKSILKGYNDNNKDKEYLIQVEELLSKVEVITVVSDDISNIFLYFDSLNNRGLQLTQMDIIRNKFFNIIKNKFPSMLDKFGEMWDELVTILDEYDCVKFLKYFYMCEERNIFSSKELPNKYELMFEKVYTYENMESMINRLIDYAKIYVELFSKELNNNIESEYINKINFLGQQACYSFTMDYFYFVKDENRRMNILKNLLSMNYKRIICNCSPKPLDGIFKKLINIRDNNEYDDETIIDTIRENSPSNESLEKELKSKIWDKDNTTLYTLYLLNKEQINFDEIENKKLYKIEFLPLGNRMSKDIYSFFLLENKVVMQIRSVEEIKELTQLEFTKYILDSSDDKETYINKIVDKLLDQI